MSTRYNTGNPIESTDVRDMSDNAKNFDEFSNSMSDSFSDRFGLDRQTIEGSIRKAGFQPAPFDFVTGGTLVPGDRNKAVFNPSPSGDDNWYAWQGALPKVISPSSTPATTGGFGEIAWKPVTNNILAPTVREAIRRSCAEAGYSLVAGSFEGGGTVVNTSQVLMYEASGKVYSWGGELPKTVPVGSTPATSGGIGASAWIDRSNALLKDIVSVTVKSIASLRLIDKSMFYRAFVEGYYAKGDGGGGHYWYDPADTASADNGGTVIVASDGGRWKLILSDNISVLQFGAKRNVSGIDNSVYFNAALNAAATLGLWVSVPAGAYFVSNSIMMPNRGSLTGTPSSWAYGDGGFSLKSVIVVNNVHNFAALQPVIDVRLQRQTTLMWLDVNGGSANVCCVEYGSRTATGSDYNNHQIHYCQFNHATYGVRADYAGLIRASFNQFAVLTEVGLLSEFAMSDSTFISNYWNNIGQTSTSTDPYIKTGVAIWLGPNAGNAFIGGKIEWCRVGVVGVGTSYLRLDSMWMDYNTFAHVLLLGDPTGPGRNNAINGCVFSGGGVLDGNGAAIDVRGNGFSMSVAITGGAIKALTDALLEDSANATYGPKLSGVKAVNSTGVISVSGVDMIKCSKQFGVYLDSTKCIDTAVCDLPNAVTNGAVRNGYAYDAGNTYRGIILRHATSDAVAAGEGVGIGAQYRNSNAVQIRLA